MVQLHNVVNMSIRNGKISIHRTGCCGMRIVRGIDGMSPDKVVFFIFRAMYYSTYNAAFVMFSDKDMSSAKRLCEYIVKNKLGNVRQNGNVFMWEVNHTESGRWMSKSKTP